jgi:hypothetical protein
MTNPPNTPITVVIDLVNDTEYVVTPDQPLTLHSLPANPRRTRNRRYRPRNRAGLRLFRINVQRDLHARLQEEADLEQAIQESLQPIEPPKRELTHEEITENMKKKLKTIDLYKCCLLPRDVNVDPEICVVCANE